MTESTGSESPELRSLLGLGDNSFRKSYFPELQKTIQRLEEEREKFRTIFNNSVQLIGLLDLDGRLLEANTRALDMIKKSAGDVIGRYFWETDWWPRDPDARARVQNAVCRASQGEPVHFETSHLMPDGRMMEIDFTITPLRNSVGQIIMLIPEGRDITERKHMETRIREMNEELERKVAERTRSLQQAINDLERTRDKLIEAEKVSALGHLVAGISHEINTPLGISYTGISFLREKFAAMSSSYRNHNLGEQEFTHLLEELGEVSVLVERNLQRVSELVRSFKELSVDQISEKRRVLDLGKYLADIVHSYTSNLTQGAHQIHIQCPVNLILDTYPGALSQVIGQLIINALTHGFIDRRQGVITLSVIQEEDRVIIACEDNGRGIPAANRRKVFDPFFTTNRGGGSSGLGLNLVWNLVTQVLGGQIDLVSPPSGGAKFILTIPIRNPGPGPA